MEHYFQPDIVTNILPFLDKDSSFHFLNIAKFLKPQKQILYGKYLFFCYRLDNACKQYICHVKVKCIPTDIDKYVNLMSMEINDDEFDSPIYRLPNNLQSLRIITEKFNQQLDHLPKNLQELHVHDKSEYHKSFGFKQFFDKLPENLKSLSLISEKYNLSINNLPNGLQNLILSDVLEKVTVKFPKSLQSLYIQGHLIKQSFDDLPNTLINLTIRSNHYDKSLDNLPPNLRSLIVDCKFCQIK